VFYLEGAYVVVTIHVYCKSMFQMFQLFRKYIASILSGCCICCSCYTHMLQTYVLNVSPISDVCHSKYFILQVFLLAGMGNERRRRWSLRAYAAAWRAWASGRELASGGRIWSKTYLGTE
jgi:uncharacterized integral membrane protein